MGGKGLCWGLGVLSSVAIILLRKRYGCFALIVFLMAFDCLCFVSLPRGAMVSSVIVAFRGESRMLERGSYV